MLTESQALEIIAKELKFPPFRLTIRDDMVFQDRPASQRPDIVLTIDWEGAGSKNFAVEYKSTTGLASLGAAVMRAQAVAYANANFGLLPLVVVPSLRPEALDELVRLKTSGLDLSGNGVLYAPGSWFAYRTGEKNRYPSSAPTTNAYRGERSIVVRALLARDTFETQNDIVKYLSDFGISASTVSKVLSSLEEDLLVTRKPSIRAERPDFILDRLRESYRTPKVRSQLRIRLHLTDTVKQRLNEPAQQDTVWYAISSPAKYTVLPSSSDTLKVFTSDSKALLDGIQYQVDDRFPTIEINEIDSRLPFFGRVFDQGLWWTSALQEYLEMASSGKREQEAAVSIRQQILSARER